MKTIRLTLRHNGRRYEWRKTNDVTAEWRIGMRDLMETKEWLGEKFNKDKLVFTVDSPTNALSTFELQITMKGSDKRVMREKLLEIVKEFDSSYGKPCQGTISQYHLETKVSTPIWNGEEY